MTIITGLMRHWDECYPKYDVKGRGLALALYWDEYNATVSKLSKEYPDNIQIYDIDRLDSIAGQKEILEFCGYLNPVIKLPLTFNRSSIKDGIGLI